jgi:hypothetical protein
MEASLVVIVWLLSAGISAWIADRKGLSVGRWALAGLAVGIFAVIVVSVMPSKTYSGAREAFVPIASLSHSGVHYAQQIDDEKGRRTPKTALCGATAAGEIAARVNCLECLSEASAPVIGGILATPPTEWWKDRSGPAYWIVRGGAAVAVGGFVFYVVGNLLGGSAIDRDAVAAEISRGIAAQAGVRANVDCPSGQPAKAGTAFVCTVRAGSEVGHARVDVLNDQGDIRWILMP